MRARAEPLAQPAALEEGFRAFHRLRLVVSRAGQAFLPTLVWGLAASQASQAILAILAGHLATRGGPCTGRACPQCRGKVEEKAKADSRMAVVRIAPRRPKVLTPRGPGGDGRPPRLARQNTVGNASERRVTRRRTRKRKATAKRAVGEVKK